MYEESKPAWIPQGFIVKIKSGHEYDNYWSKTCQQQPASFQGNKLGFARNSEKVTSMPLMFYALNFKETG